MREEVYHQYAQDLSDEHWWVSHRRQLFTSWLAQSGAPRGGTNQVLELGSGVGTEFSFLSTLGSVTGIELSSVGARYCQQRGYARLVNADLNEVDFGQGAYDFVVDFHVLYHSWVKDPRAVLARLYDALKPGGYLLLSEPAYALLSRAHDRVVMAARRWNRKDLLQLITSAGYQVERWSGMLAPVLPLALAHAVVDRFRAPTSDIAELKGGSALAERALGWLLRGERSIAIRAPVPFGTCWAVLARKPRDTP